MYCSLKGDLECLLYQSAKYKAAPNLFPNCLLHLTERIDSVTECGARPSARRYPHLLDMKLKKPFSLHFEVL